MVCQMTNLALAAFQFSDVGVEDDGSFLGPLLVRQNPTLIIELLLEHTLRLPMFFHPLAELLVQLQIKQLWVRKQAGRTACDLGGDHVLIADAWDDYINERWKEF